MSLWYECGNGFAKSKHLARGDLGADLYLCCPGPSLKDVDPESLKVPGAFTMAINTAYPRIKPDLWMGMDMPSCYHKGIWWEPFTKILRSTYCNETVGGKPISRCPAVYFADLENANPAEMFRRRAHDVKFVWASNTFHVALHVAVWMGARRIYLLGCDFGGKQDYYDDRILSGEHRERNHRLYRTLVKSLKTLNEIGRKSGIEIISCTPDSPANDQIPFMPLEDALARSQQRVPDIVSNEPVYCTDALKCKWSAPTGLQRGVMTGADAAQEWLLPWWYENLRKANPDIEVAFADFGMSPPMKYWSAQRGKVLKVGDVPGLTWHRKPFALLASPFQETVWLDADCEIRGDVSGMFEYACRGLGLTQDAHASQANNPPGAWATGVIACSHAEPAIEEWCKEIMAHEEHRGDQEALNAIRDRLAGRIVEMPQEWQWLRLDGDSDTANVMHWTGGKGKQIIARQKVA